MDELPDSWNENAPLVMVTKMCIGPDRSRVRFIMREEPNNPTDSGWVFFSGLESDEYNNDSKNYAVCPLVRFVELEPSLISILESPIGSMYERVTDDSSWESVEDYDPVQKAHNKLVKGTPGGALH